MFREKLTTDIVSVVVIVPSKSRMRVGGIVGLFDSRLLCGRKIRMVLVIGLCFGKDAMLLEIFSYSLNKDCWRKRL